MYLLSNIYFIPLNVVLLKYNTFVPAVFLIHATLFAMTLNYSKDAVCILSIVANLRVFLDIFSLGKGKKFWKINTGEYGGWGIITVLLLAK